MKKFFIIVLSIVFAGAVMTSCKARHERCAAYGKINKIDPEKSFINKTEKPI